MLSRRFGSGSPLFIFAAVLLSMGCDCGPPQDVERQALITMVDAGSPDLATKPADMSKPADLAIPPDLSPPAVGVTIPDGMIATSPEVAQCFFRMCTMRAVQGQTLAAQTSRWRGPFEAAAVKQITAYLGNDLVLLNDACAYLMAHPVITQDPLKLYTMDTYYKDLSGAANPWSYLIKCPADLSLGNLCGGRTFYDLPKWRPTYDYFVAPRNTDKYTLPLCHKDNVTPF